MSPSKMRGTWAPSIGPSRACKHALPGNGQVNAGIHRKAASMRSSILSCARSRSGHQSLTSMSISSDRRRALSAQGERWHHPGRQSHVLDAGECGMTEAPKILLDHHLASVLREYGKLARPAADAARSIICAPSRAAADAARSIICAPSRAGCGGGAGSCPIPCAVGRAGNDRSRAANDRAPHQGGQVPGGQEPPLSWFAGKPLPVAPLSVNACIHLPGNGQGMPACPRRGQRIASTSRRSPA